MTFSYYYLLFFRTFKIEAGKYKNIYNYFMVMQFAKL